MCVLYFLALLFNIYAIIGIITGIMFHYEYEWKVDLNVSPEKFGACWPKYIPILISKFKTIRKENNRNKVYDVLSDIKYYKDVEKSYQNTCNKTAGCLTMGSGLVGTYLALNQELIESIKPNGYLEFKGKRYMMDINGNILPLNLD